MPKPKKPTSSVPSPSSVVDGLATQPTDNDPPQCTSESRPFAATPKEAALSNYTPPVSQGPAVDNKGVLAAPSPSLITQDFNLRAFLVEPGPVEIPVDAGIEIVHVRKPAPNRYVSVHPDKKYAWIIPEDRDIRRDAYLVAPAIGARHMPICRKAMLAAWVDQFGNYGVWPVMQENAAGDIHPYSVSAMKKIDVAIAERRWFAFRTVTGQQAYQLCAAVEDYGVPKWPIEGPELLIDIGFADRHIDREDDPVLQKLLGKVVHAHD